MNLLAPALTDYLENLAQVSCVDSAWAVFNEGVSELGFDVAMYGEGDALPHPTCCECWHSLPKGFVDRLEEAELDVDPLVWAATRSTLPISFRGLEDCQELHGNVRALIGEASHWGVIEGFVVPLRTLDNKPSYISLHGSSARGYQDAHAHHHDAHLMALYFHNRVLVLQTRPGPQQQLTPREHEVLAWTASGKTAWEISVILSVSERTVHFHVQNAMRKLDAVTKTQAVARAVSWGLLNI